MAINIQQSIYTELADFLVSQPTLEALAAYKVSPNIQQYIDSLLEKIGKVVYRQKHVWISKKFWPFHMS